MSSLTHTARWAGAARVPATLALLLLACLGCGGDQGPKLVSVTGTVTLDGKPVQGALLEFVPQEPGRSTAWGSTDENGYYEMAFGHHRMGAFPGRTLVRIIWDDQMSVGGRQYKRTEVFPPRYNVTSEEYVDLVDGKNEFNFQCESGEFKPRQGADAEGGT